MDGIKKKVKIFPKMSKCSCKAALHLTDYPLSVFRSEADDLHLYVGSADRTEDLLHLGPHAEHRAAQNEVRPAPKADLTLKTHRRFLTVPPPEDRATETATFRVDGRLVLLTLVNVDFVGFIVT